VGARLNGKLPAHFDYDVEMARQTGSLGVDSIQAWAGHWLLGHSFENIAAKPRLWVESNYASGNRNPNSRTWNTFDQIYPSSHDKLDFADQVGWRNIEQARAGIEESAGKKWKFTESYADFWLASTADGLYASSGFLAVATPGPGAPRHVGQEIDAWAEWNFRTAVDFGFGYAHMITGAFLNRTTMGRDYLYPFVYLTYHFTNQAEN
jgi:hypothetical protein